MANIRQIKRRIRSVQSTAKITNAMSMVAASKMRRAQQRGIQGRPYAEKIQAVMANLMAVRRDAEVELPLMDQRPVRRIAYIHITSDRGLCGPLNSNMNRAGHAFIREQTVPVNLVAVGRRGRDFMARAGHDLRGTFLELGDSPTLLDTLAISRLVMDDYIAGAIDAVYLGYSDFVNTIPQRPVIQRLIPVEPAELTAGQQVDYLYEPAPRPVLERLLPRYVEMQVYHAILEHIASEQSARMVAMRNASEAAKDMIRDLTLVYNKARQEAITTEMLDIISGSAALE